MNLNKNVNKNFKTLKQILLLIFLCFIIAKIIIFRFRLVRLSLV
jgi:hypothetical protein